MTQCQLAHPSVEMLSQTPLRVSTMTITGNIHSAPDLNKLFENCQIIPYWFVGEGIIKISIGRGETQKTKGKCTSDILRLEPKHSDGFFNQSSIVFRVKVGDSFWKEVNIKLFKNGGFQMTGISSDEMGRTALAHMLELNIGRGIWPDDDPPYIKQFNICMMNSDFKLGRLIRRDKLFEIAIKEYGLWSTYEPTIYQGVNIKYFWNKHNTKYPGICVCAKPCRGNGDGKSLGNCRKITLAPFQTGSVIINGAQTMQQLDDVYAFIMAVFEKHQDTVLRPAVAATIPPVSTRSGLDILRHKMRTTPRRKITVAAFSST